MLRTKREMRGEIAHKAGDRGGGLGERGGLEEGIERGGLGGDAEAQRRGIGGVGKGKQSPPCLWKNHASL